MTDVYHCCMPKTGSQWIRAILSDPKVHVYSGLTSFKFQETESGVSSTRMVPDPRFEEALPINTIATPVFADYASYARIPKPAAFKTFFVMRDPRDIVVSWYFSSSIRTRSWGASPRSVTTSGAFRAPTD